MSGRDANRADREVEKGSWGELFSGGRGLYTALVIGGIAMHGTQILVIAIIMPTIVADIGGAVYYTWAAMIYTIGSIVGASSTGAVWSKFGARNGYALGAAIFALGTTVCALAPDMATLVVARGAQGWAGGLVSGGGTALIASLYDARLRTRILALSQGAFTLCHLSGPIVGGVFATIHWWRGSFWLMVPFMVAFAILARLKIPDRLDTEAERGRAAALPALPPGDARDRRVLRRRHRTDRQRHHADRAHRRGGRTGWFGVPARPRRRQPALSLARLVADRAGRSVIVDIDAARDVADIGDLVLAAAAAGGAWRLAAVRQFRHHHHLVRVDRRHGLVVRLVGRARARGIVGGTAARLRVARHHHARRAPAGARSAGAAAFVMGIGIGIYNVHLVARTMAGAAEGEQRITAAALTSIRSLGTAFGAAIAGVIANAAGLGDATEPQAVGARRHLRLCLLLDPARARGDVHVPLPAHRHAAGRARAGQRRLSAPLAPPPPQ